VVGARTLYNVEKWDVSDSNYCSCINYIMSLPTELSSWDYFFFNPEKIKDKKRK